MPPLTPGICSRAVSLHGLDGPQVMVTGPLFWLVKLFEPTPTLKVTTAWRFGGAVATLLRKSDTGDSAAVMQLPPWVGLKSARLLITALALQRRTSMALIVCPRLALAVTVTVSPSTRFVVGVALIARPAGRGSVSAEAGEVPPATATSVDRNSATAVRTPAERVRDDETMERLRRAAGRNRTRARRVRWRPRLR